MLNKALHADTYCYARFVYVATLQYHTKRSPQYVPVSLTLGLKEIVVLSSEYSIKLEGPSVKEFCSLREKIGWGETDLDIAKISLGNSLFHVTIRYKAQLIAMGRVVGDGAMYFYIQDVVVDPDHQSTGLGSALMDQIESYLLVAAKKGSTIGLLAAKGKEGFYTRYGYTQRPNIDLGNGMCKFV